MAEYNLYDAPTTFTLRFVSEGKVIPIEEPVGTDGMSIALIRDKDYFGFSTEFIKSGTTLGFDFEAGRDEIKRAWETYGVDAEVEFKMEQNGDVLFKGLLKFATYSDDGAVINIEIERTNFEELFRTRFDTPTDLQAVQTLDGVAIKGLSSKNITLHSKRITKSAISDLDGVTEVEKEAEYTGGYQIRTLLLPTYNIRYDEFDEEVMKTTACMMDGKTAGDHYNNFDYQFKTSEAGLYNISVQTSFDLDIETATEVSSIGRVLILCFLIVDVPDSLGVQVGNMQVLTRETLYDQSISSGRKARLENLNLQYSTEVHLNPEQRVYLFVEISFWGGAAMTVVSTKAQVQSLLFSVTALTEAPSSVCAAFDLVEAFEQNLRIATNSPSRVLKSDFLNSIRGKYAISNGFRVRQFSGDFKQLTGTLKDFMEALNAIWTLGYSFIEENGVSLLRVEPLMWFFNSDYCVHSCQEVFDYTETTATDLLLNEFEIGYEKYADNDLHTLLEFSTYRQYLLPLKRFKGKASKKSGFIASGYMIEILRRIQFAKKPKDSDTNDDSIFLFTLSDINRSECERDEAFTRVSGEDDVSSIYNARISPARMALNWIPFLSSLCYHKPNTEQIRCQFYKQNGAFTTELKGEPFSITEYQDFRVSRNKKFIPSISEFKTPMYAKDYLRIRDSLLSRLAEDENNGYIQFFDHLGTIKTGWVMEMEYDAYRELASMTLLLRNSLYVEQPTYDEEEPPSPDTEYEWVLDLSGLERVKQFNGSYFDGDTTVTITWSPVDPSTLPKPVPAPAYMDYKAGVKKDDAPYTVVFTGSNTGKTLTYTINVWWNAIIS